MPCRSPFAVASGYHAAMIVLLLIACHADPDAPRGAEPDEPTMPVGPRPALSFDRVAGREMPPGVDSWSWSCDGDEWVIEAETVGPIDRVELWLFEPVDGGWSTKIALTEEAAPEGAVWQRHVGTLPSSERSCAASEGVLVGQLSAFQGQERVSCAVRGAAANDVLAGLVSRPSDADWSGCLGPSAL